MRIRVSLWATLAISASGSFALAQTTPVDPLPARAPMTLPGLPIPSAAPPQASPVSRMAPPMLPIEGAKESSVPMPMAAPPAMPQLAPSTIPPMIPPNSIPSGCTTCGDITPKCTDPGCGGFNTLMGPKNPVWLQYNQRLLWFKPSGQNFPIATLNGQNVLGNNNVQLGQYNTFGASGGLWVNEPHTVGIGMDGFITEQRTRVDTVAGSAGLIRPFLDATTGQPSFVSVGDAGSLAVQNRARLASGGINLQKIIKHNEQLTLSAFFGFRYIDLDESLTIFQDSTLPINLPNQVGLVNQNFQLTDRIYTRNQFYGGEFGGRAEFRHGIFSLSFTPKIAFGPNHQVTYIDGKTVAGGQTFSGGLLAAGTSPNGDIGRFITNRFTVAGDIGTQLGVTVTKGVRILAGYNFYFLSNVARPAAQVDPVINTAVLPISNNFVPNNGPFVGPVAPRVTFDREGFYAHGVSLSAEISY